MEARPPQDAGSATSRPDGAIDAACRRWVAYVDRRPGFVLTVASLLTAVFGLYAALNLGVNADIQRLIAQDLPFQVRQRQLDETFHTMLHGFIVVVDADSPFAARRAADRLAERLSARTDLFSQVDVPGGGPFFARNALLYLTPEQLDDLADRLSAAQPFLATLAKDRSLVGISDLVGDALDAERQGTSTGADLTLVLERIRVVVEATMQGKTAPDPWGSALLSNTLPAEARRRLVVLRPRLRESSLLFAAPALDAIRTTARDLNLTPEQGITVRITGEPALNHEQHLALLTQTRAVGIAAFLLFTGAVVFALRSPRIVLALVGSLVASLVWGNAFAAATVGELNQISACYNVLLIGLGGEFGIHFCARYAELIGKGYPRTEALAETAATTGSSLFSSAVTTASGFFIFLLTDFTGVGELGLISGVGMFLSLASTLTILPALLVIGSPRLPKVSQATAPWLARLEHLPVKYARPLRLAALGLAAAAIALMPRVRYDANLLNLRDPSTESVQAFEDLLADSGTTPWTIDVMTATMADAQALARRLRALPVVDRVRTLEDFVPADQEEKREILAAAAYFVPSFAEDGPLPDAATQRLALARMRDEALRAGANGTVKLRDSARQLAATLEDFLVRSSDDAAIRKLQSSVLGSLPEQVRDLSALLSPDTITLAGLPRSLTEQMLADDGRARLEVFPRGDVNDSTALAHFVDVVRTVAPQASGGAVWLVDWGRVTWKAMLAALLGAMACMIVFLVLLWRSLWDTLLAFFPLALASLLTCASLVVLGHPFNFANVIVIPMLVGMGVDNGVHLLHRHRTNPDEVDVLATSTAKAVFYSAVTTILSFGTLSFAGHRGLAAVGQLLTIGVAITLVCFVVVLPAVLEWDDRRRRPRAAGRAGRGAGR